jgi:hypothetical protein
MRNFAKFDSPLDEIQSPERSNFQMSLYLKRSGLTMTIAQWLRGKHQKLAAKFDLNGTITVRIRIKSPMDSTGMTRTEKSNA